MFSFLRWLARKQCALQEGYAHRVVFYYYGEEPTYLEDAFVSVFRNGVVEIQHRNEHVTTHAQNVEILWKPRPQSLGKIPSGRALTLIKTDTNSVNPNSPQA